MQGRLSRKERAALLSVAATLAITVAKGAAGVLTGSLALISDALHSLLDVVSSAATFFVVRFADKPADATHPYGHEKIEPLAALGQTILLAMVAGAVVFEGLRRLGSGQAGSVEAPPIAFAILGVSIAIDVWRWRSLRRAAQETGSHALAADALHFSSDLANSALVILALVAAMFGYPQVDALVAVGVALFIAVAGVRLGRRTVDALIDAAPSGVEQRMREAATAAPGVLGVERLRVRTSGARTLGDLDLALPRSLTLDQVAAVKADVAARLRVAQPGADITLSTTPRALDEEPILERIMLVAARQRILIHRVLLQQVEARLTVSLDLEIDARMSLSAAHRRATGLERAVQDELGAHVEVDTHIEPLEPQEVEGRDVPEEERGPLALVLAELAVQSGELSQVHNVRVRRTERGLVVNFHCRAEPALTVAEAHARIDRLERRLRERLPAVGRIVGHVEPLQGDHP